MTAPVGSRFRRGEAVVWRSRPQGSIGYTLPATVVTDGPGFTLLFQPSGTICKRRAGRRGGPQGRNLVEWNGLHEDVRYTGPSTARLHVHGSGFEVVRAWHHDAYHGWYINLVDPWTRTELGFDTCDRTLDIVVDDDLAAWAWKDEDEFAYALERGSLSNQQAERVRQSGHAALNLLRERAFPFDRDWSEFAPEADWPVPALPANWASNS